MLATSSILSSRKSDSCPEMATQVAKYRELCVEMNLASIFPQFTISRLGVNFELAVSPRVSCNWEIVATR